MNNISKTIIGVAAVLCTSTVVAAAGLNLPNKEAATNMDSSITDTTNIQVDTTLAPDTTALPTTAETTTTGATTTAKVAATTAAATTTEPTVLSETTTSKWPNETVYQVGDITVIQRGIVTKERPTTPF